MTDIQILQSKGILRVLSIDFLFGVLLILSVVPAWSVEPIPSFYQEPGISPNRDYVNQSSNEQIDPFTGKLQLHYVDLFVPGNGDLDIKVQRSYNSINDLLVEPTALGVGWTMHYGRVLRRAPLGICFPDLAASNAPVLELPDGSRQLLYQSMSQTYVVSTNRWRGDCAPDGSGLHVTSPEGVRYEMTTQGQLVGDVGSGQQNSFYTTRIVDRNGNTLNFSYITLGANTVISSITASDGRVVNFTYANNALATISYQGRIWEYSYVFPPDAPTFPFLTQVKRPDGNTWQFDYKFNGPGTPGAYSLTSVTYPTGGTYTYSYGHVSFNVNLPYTTVVTQKTSQDPIGTWTYSYTPASMMGDFNNGIYQFPNPAMLDRTIITGPDGVQEYRHIGANSIGSGFVFGIGALLVKNIDNGLHTEYSSWDGQQISASANVRPGASWIQDSATFTLIPSQKYIVRNGQAYVTTYSNYDAYGNAQTIAEAGTSTGPGGSGDTRTTQITYDIRLARWMLRLPQTTTVDTVPGTVTNSYDTNGNLLSVNRYGVLTQSTYLPTGDVETKTDARGNVITYSNYFRGTPQLETHPESVTIQRVVDIAGNVTSETDGEGVTTQYAYDGLNRLTSIVHAEGNPVTVTWLTTERRVQRGNYLERTLFDSYARAITVEHQGGSGVATVTQNTQYDALGRKIFVSYPNQSTGEAMSYDMLGRTVLVKHVASPTATPGVYTNTGGQASTSFSGNTSTVTNERGWSTTRTLRAYGDPDKSVVMGIATPVSAANIAITRNGLDQITQVSQGGKTRTSTYDSRYFLTQSTDPEVGTTLFGRDAAGNMTSRQVGSSGTVAYTYDGRNRLSTVTYPSGTPSVTHTYFRDDKPKSTDNGLTRREYTYRLNKRPDQEKLMVDGRTFTVTYGYDGNDALQGMTYSSGLALTYSPDSFGRPTQAAPFATAVSFFPGGQVQQMQYANGTVTNFGLNPRQWPNAMTVASNGGAQAFNMGYNYDDTGNVLNITESVRGIHNRTFGYDSLDRLTAVLMPNSGGGTIAYDGRGNILSQNFGSTQLTYQYDSLSDKLTSISGSRTMAFGYDVYGNVTSNSRNQFVYDDALNMRCVDCGTANEIRYVYDGAGMRVSELKSGVTTYFMYGNGGNLLFEVDTNGVKREYGYVAGKNIAKKETR